MGASFSRCLLAALLMSCGRIGYDELVAGGPFPGAGGASAGDSGGPAGGSGTGAAAGADSGGVGGGSAGDSGAAANGGLSSAGTGGSSGSPSTAGAAGSDGTGGAGSGTGLGPGTVATVGARLDADYSGIADTFIIENVPTTNRGTNGALILDGLAGERQFALLRFDVSALPAGASITGAELRLVTNTNEFQNGTLQVYELLESWVEAQATWNERSTGVAWLAPGAEPGSRASEMLAEFTATIGQTEYLVPLPGSVVQKWVDDANGNFGLVVVPTGTLDGQFYSSNATSDTRRPLLAVSYE